MNPSTQKFCGDCGGAMGSTAPAATMAPTSRRTSMPPPSQAPLALEPATGARGVALQEDKVRFPLPLVGREEDLAWLEERREDAERSLGRARLIGGGGRWLYAT